MSVQHIQLGSDVNENAVRSAAMWDAPEASESERDANCCQLHARVVEFIAKPGKARDLEECVRGEITDFLNRQSGFSGAIILNSHREPRLILVLSFWTTEQMAAETCWEGSRAVRQSTGSLIDACPRVHTYEAAVAKSTDIAGDGANTQVCWPEVQR